MSTDLDQHVGQLERENRIMKRKLHRSQRNRVLAEDAKDMSDVLYHRVITDLDEMNRELAEMSKQLEEAYQVIKAQKERMEDELNVGREIQMSMLPLTFPPFPDRNEFEVYAAVEPAREVGGDFYDFFFIDEDRLCFCIADVSDKGVPAALFMAVTKALIRSRAANDGSTASILAHVNNELSRDNSACMFVTIFACMLNVKTGELVYTNAGHNPPYLKREDGALERLDQLHGLVVGAMSGEPYQQDRIMLSCGDTLLLYTDGVTEARDLERNLFSEKRLVALLSSREYESVKDIVHSTVSEVERFQGDAHQADDVTLLAVRFFGQEDDYE